MSVAWSNSNRVKWDESIGLWFDTPFIWHAVPGFAATEGPLTVCRTTHPDFAESMRCFGVPTGHPARLEQHAPLAGGGINGGWTLTIASKSYLGIVQWCLRDASNLGRGLGTADPQGDVLSLVDPNLAGARWYLVPQMPYGWDLVHAVSGRRLEVADPRTTTLVLSSNLTGLTHWDVFAPHKLRGRHRPHFWMPAFLRTPFAGTPRTTPRFTGALVPVNGGTVRDGSGVQVHTLRNLTDCIQKCEQTGCSVVSHDNEGQCVVYARGTVNGTNEAEKPYHEMKGPHYRVAGVIARERRLFRDPTGRGVAGTKEYTEDAGTNVIMFQRLPNAPDVTDTYRRCVLQLGLDAPECQQYADAQRPDPTQQLALKTAVLGDACGVATGVDATTESHKAIGGARIRSATCQAFCQHGTSRQNGSCAAKLRQYCAFQTKAGRNEPSCDCWMNDGTYADRLRETQAKLGQDSPVAQQVNAIINQSRDKNYCWYIPCSGREPNLGPPANTCKSQSINVCVNDMNGSNVLKAQRDINIIQKCEFNDAKPGGGVPTPSPAPGGGVSTPSPATAAPTTGSSSPAPGDNGIVTPTDEAVVSEEVAEEEEDKTTTAHGETMGTTTKVMIGALVATGVVGAIAYGVSASGTAAAVGAGTATTATTIDAAAASATTTNTTALAVGGLGLVVFLVVGFLVLQSSTTSKDDASAPTEEQTEDQAEQQPEEEEEPEPAVE